MAEAQGSNRVVLIVAIVGGVLLVGVAVVGILASLAIFGFRRYLTDAKSAEGRAEVTALAVGIVYCSDTAPSHELPPSAPPVPARLAQVSGMKYQSAPADWSDATYTCAKFQVTAPQYFQYEWLRQSATSGQVEARADFDGDGSPDVVFQVPVTCAAGHCEKGTLTELRP